MKILRTQSIIERSGRPPDVFGPPFPGKDGSVIIRIRELILLAVERGGVGPPSLLVDDRLESSKMTATSTGQTIGSPTMISNFAYICREVDKRRAR